MVTTYNGMLCMAAKSGCERGLPCIDILMSCGSYGELSVLNAAFGPRDVVPDSWCDSEDNRYVQLHRKWSSGKTMCRDMADGCMQCWRMQQLAIAS